MVNYICDKCSKNFNKKSNYINHIDNKKKPCNKYNIKIIENTINSCKILQTPANILQTPAISQQKTIIKNKYICNFCDKSFTRIDNFKIHLEKRCKIRKEETKDKEKIFIKLLEDHKEEMNLIIKKKDEQINILSSEIMNLKTKKLGKKVINKNLTNNNTINNGTINNTINIIQHGKEDLSKIGNNVFLSALLKYSGAQIPSKIIEGIHFNNSYPEFKNIYISDINREKVMMYNGKEWLLSPSNNITSNLLDKSINFSENRYENLEENINDKSKKKLTKEIKMMELMKEFDELEMVFNSDSDDEGKQLSPKDIERRKYLRLKAEEYIKLLLYNNRNNMLIEQQ